MCACAEPTLPKYKTLVRKVSATWEEKFDVRVTHILVGTAAPDAQTAQLVSRCCQSGIGFGGLSPSIGMTCLSHRCRSPLSDLQSLAFRNKK